jgi:cytochrome c oxidase subunit 2
MSISSIPPGWWKAPLIAEEKIWVSIALAWCIFISVAMPAWHFVGNQNPSQEFYTISTKDFGQLTDKFIEKYKTGTEKVKDVEWDVVTAPDSVDGKPADVFVRAQQWKWDPILKLKAGQKYRIHLSSVDVLHGFSIQPIQMNFEAVPGWDYVLTITPAKAGDYRILCNEFCGAEHHMMVGKIIVE